MQIDLSTLTSDELTDRARSIDNSRQIVEHHLRQGVGTGSVLAMQLLKLNRYERRVLSEARRRLEGAINGLM